MRWLASQVNASADLTGLQDAGGSFLDFRPGLEEKSPSLSASVGQDGAAVFHRFGGDDFEGGAVAFTMSCLNVTKGEAARLLIERAGIVDTPSERKTTPTVKPAGQRAAKAQAALSKLHPLNPDKGRAALRGWVKIRPDEDTPEAVELARRGVAPALASGALTAYRWTGKVGPEGGPWKTVRLPAHVRPGAVAFDVTGPDGTPWAVKARNPGSKEELAAVNAQRYVYVTAGQSTPAWVRRLPRDTQDGVRFLIVEGELNAAACAVMLEAAASGAGHIQPNEEAHGWEVQGVASAVAWPHVAHIPAGAHVYLWADPDPEGEAARVKWGELLAAQGAQVYQLGATSSGQTFPFAVGGDLTTDACDALGTLPDVPGRPAPDAHAAYLGGKILAAVERAPRWTPQPAKEEDAPPEGQDGDVWTTKRSGYGVRGGKLCALSIKKGDEGEEYESAEVLADFAALIVSEVRQEDGAGEAARVFEVQGTRPDGRPMHPPRVMVTAAEFSGMAWPVKEWGAAGMVHAGQGKKDKARAAVQAMSNARGVTERTVYQHTGWTTHPEHGPVYLTAGAVIGAAGGVPGVDVELSGRLGRYALPDPAREERQDVCAAVRASLALADLAPDAVAVPVLGAVYRAPLGAADFAVWVTGETGRHKTAFMGLVMAHHGAGWSRKFLPDGWNSSANALEKNAFTVKDGLFLVDDFKPSGSASDTAKAYAAVSRVLQGVADGQGRGTLTMNRESRAALFPRGLVMSSSEDLPRGHSNRARAVIVEVTRPLIDSPARSAAYFDGEEKAAAGVYALALAAFIQAVAAVFAGVTAGSPAHRARVRALAPAFQGAHGRTGDAAAELAYSWEVWLSFAVAVGAIDEGKAVERWARVVSALRDTASGQGGHLQEADPVARALAVLSGLLAQGRVYLEDLADGGPVPEDAAALCGYVLRRTGDGAESYGTKPGAVMVGYYSKEGGDTWAHFLPDALHEALQRAVSGQGGAMLPDASKLWANMRDRLHPAGLMRCEAEAGGRMRATAKRKAPDGTRRHFITLRLPLEGAYESVGTLGTLGTQGVLTPSETVLNCVPNLNYFSGLLGTLGTQEKGSPSPSPDPLADLAHVGEAWTVDV